MSTGRDLPDKTGASIDPGQQSALSVSISLFPLISVKTIVSRLRRMRSNH
jgi:hypothetical protein